jgi:D-alanine-D-alanine ligase-like ATP-grasp enzyme
MSYELYTEKLEVAHHTGKTLRINVAAAFQRFLTLLTALRTLKTIQQLLKLGDVKVVVSRTLTNGNRRSHWFLLVKKLLSEVAHHAGKTLRVDIAAAFQRFLALLTTFGAFETIEQLFKLSDIKIVVSRTLTSGNRRSHDVLKTYSNYSNLSF